MWSKGWQHKNGRDSPKAGQYILMMAGPDMIGTSNTGPTQAKHRLTVLPCMAPHWVQNATSDQGINGLCRGKWPRFPCSRAHTGQRYKEKYKPPIITRDVWCHLDQGNPSQRGGNQRDYLIRIAIYHKHWSAWTLGGSYRGVNHG